jgi:small subunit ribosomal protein S20
MANHKSAEKRNRQRVVRTVRGRAIRSRVRTAVKEARAALSEGRDDAAALVKKAHSLLDRAASKHVVPQNRAARLKSRLSLASTAKSE